MHGTPFFEPQEALQNSEPAHPSQKGWVRVLTAPSTSPQPTTVHPKRSSLAPLAPTCYEAELLLSSLPARVRGGELRPGERSPRKPEKHRAARCWSGCSGAGSWELPAGSSHTICTIESRILTIHHLEVGAFWGGVPNGKSWEPGEAPPGGLNWAVLGWGREPNPVGEEVSEPPCLEHGQRWTLAQLGESALAKLPV